MRRGLLGAAVGIAGVTVLSRIVGFGRTGVLARTLGPSCVGDTYAAANAIPNVVFEVVAGGALAALVVPLLAGAVSTGDRAAASRTASALLTWTLIVLAPVALLAGVAAPYLLRALAGPDPACGPALLDVGARMLVVFAPQIVLYGVGIVVAGILQAHRRFLGPALAPLLSSLVVVSAYALYAAQGRVPLRDLTRSQELTLSVGTTLGVAALSLTLLVPLRRCGLVLRPTLGFPPGVAGRVRRLALAGAVGLAAQQVALVVALRLAANGAEGSVVLFQLATALFLLPWAVLAVPVATSAFTDLSAAGDESAYASAASRSLSAVLVVTVGAAVLLAAAALPISRLLVAGAPGPEDVDALARATAAFAPGLVGYGLVALLARALYARGDGATPAVATVAGWLTVAVADVLLVSALPDLDRVVALGVGNTIGMTVAGALLLLGVRRVSAPSLQGAARTAGVCLTAGLLAAAAAVSLPEVGQSVAASAISAVVVALITVGVYVGVLALLRPGALRDVLRA